MKLQTLTIIFLLIILPISMVTSQYIKTEINTINTQTLYDSRLNNATYDAIKSFELNESNSKTENIPTEKIRDVKASINSFYNSLASGMGASGYSEDDLRPYIPCLVYTLYDGYYIYTSYKDTVTGDQEYGLKPYVYYTENIRGTDITITYTLDNFITITGTIENKYQTKSGYLCISNSNSINTDENLKELVAFNGRVGEYTYTYLKNEEQNQFMKYYYINGEWYSYGVGGIVKVTSIPTINSLNNNINNNSASQYISESLEFTNWVNKNLANKVKDENGVNYLDFTDNKNNPDSYNSAFNEHRRNVIKNSIKSNLEKTIINYRLGETEFKMPDLDETEWDKIINNVSLISFMQGLPLKNKLYMGYSVVTNTKSREFVDPDEIYIINNNAYHKITCKANESSNSNYIAYRNIDFKRKSYNYTDSNGDTQTGYYYPHGESGCYECIVTSTNVYSSTQEALDSSNVSEELKRAYYTALYRERYINYKSLNLK